MKTLLLLSALTFSFTVAKGQNKSDKPAMKPVKVTTIQKQVAKKEVVKKKTTAKTVSTVKVVRVSDRKVGGNEDKIEVANKVKVSRTSNEDFPLKKNTGNPIADEKDYQVRKKQWVANNPQKYERLKGKSNSSNKTSSPNTILIPTKVTNN